MILKLLQLIAIARSSVMTFLSDQAHVSHFSPQNKDSKRGFRIDAIEEPFLYPQSTEPFFLSVKNILIIWRWPFSHYKEPFAQWKDSMYVEAGTINANKEPFFF